MNLEFDALNGKKYYLSQRALEHIIHGEFNTQPIGNGQVKSILSGGLHIKDGFESFLKNHPTIVHLYNYNSSLHEDWFYVRELQNGVLTAKLPRTLFNKRAASKNNNTTLIQKIEQKIEVKIGKDIPPYPEFLPKFIKEKIGFE